MANNLIQTFESICASNGDDTAFYVSSSYHDYHYEQQQQQQQQQLHSQIPPTTTHHHHHHHHHPPPQPPSLQTIGFSELNEASQSIALELYHRHAVRPPPPHPPPSANNPPPPPVILIVSSQPSPGETAAVLACTRLHIPFVPLPLNSSTHRTNDERLEMVLGELCVVAVVWVMEFPNVGMARAADGDDGDGGGGGGEEEEEEEELWETRPALEGANCETILLEEAIMDDHPTVMRLNRLGIHRIVCVRAVDGSVVGSMTAGLSLPSLSLSSDPQEEEEEEEAKQRKRDPMYILYTSGSTGGRPKAVVQTYSGLWNRIQWQWRTFPFVQQMRRDIGLHRTLELLREDGCLVNYNSGDGGGGMGDVVMRRTPLSFVDSMAEIFGTLLGGAPLWCCLDVDRVFVVSSSSSSSSSQIVKPPLPSSLLADLYRRRPKRNRRGKGLDEMLALAERDGVRITRLSCLPSQLSQALRYGGGGGGRRRGRTGVDVGERNHGEGNHEGATATAAAVDGSRGSSIGWKDTLNLIVVSGEACPRSLLVDFERTMTMTNTTTTTTNHNNDNTNEENHQTRKKKKSLLVNLYGQTESSGDVSCLIVSTGESSVSSSRRCDDRNGGGGRQCGSKEDYESRMADATSIARFPNAQKYVWKTRYQHHQHNKSCSSNSWTSRYERTLVPCGLPISGHSFIIVPISSEANKMTTNDKKNSNNSETEDDNTGTTVGRLYVSGPGLALGYLNDPTLTASRFLTDLSTKRSLPQQQQQQQGRTQLVTSSPSSVSSTLSSDMLYFDTSDLAFWKEGLPIVIGRAASDENDGGEWGRSLTVGKLNGIMVHTAEMDSAVESCLEFILTNWYYRFKTGNRDQDKDRHNQNGNGTTDVCTKECLPGWCRSGTVATVLVFDDEEEINGEESSGGDDDDGDGDGGSGTAQQRQSPYAASFIDLSAIVIPTPSASGDDGGKVAIAAEGVSSPTSSQPTFDEDTITEMRCWMLDKYSPTIVPRWIYFVTSLPRIGAASKIDRVKLARMAVERESRRRSMRRKRLGGGREGGEQPKCDILANDDGADERSSGSVIRSMEELVLEDVIDVYRTTLGISSDTDYGRDDGEQFFLLSSSSSFSDRQLEATFLELGGDSMLAINLTHRLLQLTNNTNANTNTNNANTNANANSCHVSVGNTVGDAAGNATKRELDDVDWTVLSPSDVMEYSIRQIFDVLKSGGYNSLLPPKSKRVRMVGVSNNNKDDDSVDKGESEPNVFENLPPHATTLLINNNNDCVDYHGHNVVVLPHYNPSPPLSSSCALSKVWKIPLLMCVDSPPMFLELSSTKKKAEKEKKRIVIAASQGGDLVGVTPEKGTVLFRIKLDGKIEGGLGVLDDNKYDNDDNNQRVHHGNNGSNDSGGIDCGPMIYVPTYDSWKRTGAVYALQLCLSFATVDNNNDNDDAVVEVKEVWRYNTTGEVKNRPLLVNIHRPSSSDSSNNNYDHYHDDDHYHHRVVVADYSGTLTYLNARTGELLDVKRSNDVVGGAVHADPIMFTSINGPGANGAGIDVEMNMNVKVKVNVVIASSTWKGRITCHTLHWDTIGPTLWSVDLWTPVYATPVVHHHYHRSSSVNNNNDGSSSPIAAPTTVLALTLCGVDGSVRSLRTDDGSSIWLIHTDKQRPIFTTPCYDVVLPSIPYTETDTMTKTRTNASTGSGGKTGGRKTMVVGSHDGKVRCLSQDDGRIVWTCNVGAPILARPLYINSDPPLNDAITDIVALVACATTAGEVVLLDVRNGVERGRCRLDGEVFSDPLPLMSLMIPVGHDGASSWTNLFVGCRDSCLYRLRLRCVG